MATPRKIVMLGTEARDELVKGAKYLAKAVKSTLGPNGTNFFIEKGNRITNDGVSVASEVEHAKEIPQRGLQALRQAATKTNDAVGDGTTSAIILAEGILDAAIRQLPDGKTFVGKMTPSEVLRKIEAERKEVTEKLVAMSTPIKTEEQLVRSAVVSVEDETLGKLIGETQWKLGPDGVIIAEGTIETDSSIELVRGIQIDNGFGTSLIMNNLEKQTLDVENTHVLLTNHTLQNLKPLKNLGESLAKTGVRNLVIIARAFTNEAIQECLANIKAGFNIWPMNAPYTDQTQIMKDLEAVLGGRFINHEEAHLDVQISDLGFAAKVVSKRSSAILTGTGDEKMQERVAKRIEEIETELKGAHSDFQDKHLKGRLAMLKNGFAILKVGATSETERKYRLDKAEDAVNAVRAAFQEGTVPGAGLAFKTIAEDLPNEYLLKRPLMAIYEQIMSTAPAGFEIPEWVRDPVKVLRIALENACSVSATLATASGATATEKEKPMWVKQASEPEDEEADE